tara:strand:- start:366 stop:560 length:195 start_codon:yes stop_codon:yes gene_type:complete
MAEEIRDDHIDSEHLEELKNNPPVEPNKDELEDYQYESAKESYDKAVKLWQEEIDKVEAQLLVE